MTLQLGQGFPDSQHAAFRGLTALAEHHHLDGVMRLKDPVRKQHSIILEHHVNVSEASIISCLLKLLDLVLREAGWYGEDNIFENHIRLLVSYFLDLLQ